MVINLLRGLRSLMSQLFTAVTGNVPGNVPITFQTDAGNATSAANVIKVLGAGATSTSGAGNTVTITSTSNVIPWTDEAVGFTAAVNNGYFCTAALTATLPAAPTQGQIVIIETVTAGSVVVQANTGQTIKMGSGASSVAGTATSTATGNSVYLVYRSVSATWYSISTEGTWLLA